MRTFARVPRPNGDVAYILKDNDKTFCHAVMVRNGVTGDTYLGVRLEIWDDKYSHLKKNIDWLTDLHTDNIRDVLAQQEFYEVEPSNLENLLYA